MQQEDDQKPYILRLPDQIMLEIFFKLSMTSLFQCWRVCKTWRCVLSDPHFTKTLISRTPSCLLLVNGSGSTSPKFLNYLHGNFMVELKSKASGEYKARLTRLTFNAPEAKMVGSCNGFLCLYNDYNPDNFGVSTGKFAVTNPMTCEEFQVVPARTMFNGWGFGYSPVSNVYKIVLFELPTRRFMNKVVLRIMTVGSAIWRNVEYAMQFSFYSQSNWIYLNGFLHLICIGNHGTLSIFAFDVETELFQCLPLPDFPMNRRTMELELTVLDGRLSLSVNSNHGFFVWVMMNYGIKESWTRYFEIRDNSVVNLSCKLLNCAQGKVLLLRNGLLYTSPPGIESMDGLVRVRGIPPLDKAWIHLPSFVSLKDAYVTRDQS